MTTEQKAKYLIGIFKSYVLATHCVDEILKNFDGLHKPEYCSFDAIGERKFIYEGEYPNHMTGYDMVDYWEEVKSHITRLEESLNII